MNIIEKTIKSYNEKISDDRQLAVTERNFVALMSDVNDDALCPYVEISKVRSKSGQTVIFEPGFDADELRELQALGLAEIEGSAHEGTVSFWDVQGLKLVVMPDNSVMGWQEYADL